VQAHGATLALRVNYNRAAKKIFFARKVLGLPVVLGVKGEL